MPSTTLFLLATVCLLAFLPSVSAFGAGEIPDFAYLNDKAFRHLDIENMLTYIVRWKGSNTMSGGFFGAALGALSSGGGGEKKFTKADVHRVYFGNWLRDYSQAMDIAGLSKATGETIILLLSVLSFMTFGFATEEFELLAEKLGVYLPVEHIDNPKGYGGDEDPRKYHPKLRPPVDPRELEIDPRTGMKNYIANDGQGWDTSAAHVRRSLRKAIALARQSGGHRSPELYEAYRLMGGALHTLEDLLAHSNWIEIFMRKMGARDVFPHVGDSVTVNAPGGERVPPLVTGTFGSADFIFSVMGEATDKLSESSVSELTKKIADAHGKENSLSTVKSLLSQMPSGGGDTQNEMQKADDIQQRAYSFDPNNYTTEEVRDTLWEVLSWRDVIMRKVGTIMEKIPGLEDLMEQLTDAMNVYIYTTIEPYVKPVLAKASDALGTGSRAVIDQDDQYEVFNNPHASDPSHSMISKDHFDNILNEPAGKIAKAVDEVAVNKIVAAWSDNNVDVDRTIDEILEALHHPYFANQRSEMQMAMAQTAEKWFNGMGNDRQATLQRLTKQSVQEGHNKRLGADQNTPMHSHTIGRQQPSRGYGEASNPGYEAVTRQYGEQQYQQRDGETYETKPARSGGGYDRQEGSYGLQESTYAQQESTYGRRQEQGREERNQDQGFSESYGGRGPTYTQDSSGYGGAEQGQSIGGYGYGQEEHERRKHGHKGETTEERYGDKGTRREQAEESAYGRGGYGGGDEYSRPNERETEPYEQPHKHRQERGGYERTEYEGGGQESESRRESRRAEYGGGGSDEYGGQASRGQGRDYSEQTYGSGGGYGQSGVTDQFEGMNIGEGRRNESGRGGGDGDYYGGEERQEGHHRHHEGRERRGEEEQEAYREGEGHSGRRKHHHGEEEYSQY